MGRSGSTLLYKSIFIALAKKNYPYLPNSIGQIISRGGIWNPNKKLFKGMVHKTHLHFSDLPKNIDAKVIFFSLPSDSVLSVISNRSRKGDLQINKHLKNLKAKGPYNEICFRDILRIEEQIDSWFNCHGKNILLIRYEKIWEFQSEIEKFINLNINFPKQNKSRRKLSEEASRKEKICRKFYSELDDKVNKLPDISFIN